MSGKDDDNPFDFSSYGDDGDSGGEGPGSWEASNEDLPPLHGTRWDEKDPAVIAAHDVAFSLIPALDLAAGHINFELYVIRFHSTLWRAVPEVTSAEREFYRSTPKLWSDPSMINFIRRIYTTRMLEMPPGLELLPVWWGSVMADSMMGARWLNRPKSYWNAVFEWKRVEMTENGYLDIYFPGPIPAQGITALDVCGPLLSLHECLDPGPFSSRGRYLEFVQS